MSKRNYTEYKWEEDIGYAQCLIHYKDKCFQGDALCHADDMPYKSRIIGEMLAECRATRDYLGWVRDNEILPQLKALNQLYYSMRHSAQFDPKSYEAKMLFRQINQREEDIRSIKQAIADSRQIERVTAKSVERIKRIHDKKPE